MSIYIRNWNLIEVRKIALMWRCNETIASWLQWLRYRSVWSAVFVPRSAAVLPRLSSVTVWTRPQHVDLRTGDVSLSRVSTVHLHESTRTRRNQGNISNLAISKILVLFRLLLRLHQDTCRPETCIPDEQHLSGYILYVDGYYLAGYKLLVRDTFRSRQYNYCSFTSRSTCIITLYPVTDGRQIDDNFVADTRYMLTATSGYNLQVDTTCIQQHMSWCKRVIRVTYRCSARRLLLIKNCIWKDKYSNLVSGRKSTYYTFIPNAILQLNGFNS